MSTEPARALPVTDLTNLLEISHALAEEIELPYLLDSIIEKAALLTDSAASSIILHDQVRDTLYFANATGPRASLLLEQWGRAGGKGIPTTGSIAGEVFTSGKPIVVDAVEEKGEHFKGIDRDTNIATASLICVPLVVRGRRIGVVQLLNKRSGKYTERDLLVLQHLAAQSAVAIRNAQLFESLLAHMGLYTAEDTRRSTLERLGELTQPPRMEALSILFADMRGFTQLCHVISRPERTLELLNEFHTMLADVVIEQQGFVNKFLGDGLLALFRGEEHSRRAVRCAGLMVERFGQLRDRWNDSTNVSLEFLDIGVGIASDEVIVGSIGSERVRDFTVIGTAVNLAANLVQNARGGCRILVDKTTFRTARGLIESFSGPATFELKKPGQAVGHPYERYWVQSLRAKPASGTPGAPRDSPSPLRHKVFISYSHSDRKWLQELQRHLKPYTRNGPITIWDDTRIRAGEKWREEIEKALASSKVAILLVSPNFLDSDFIAENELPPLLSAAESAGLRILWVPVSASSFDETPIGDYHAALDPAAPLDMLRDGERNQAWVRLCKQVKEILTGEGGTVASP